MNTKKYNWILYLITATIVTTIVVQLYWNYKNFQENRKRITNEIQISLDIAVEEYFSNLSKKNFFSFIDNDSVTFKAAFINDIWLSNSNKDSIDYNISLSTNNYNSKGFEKRIHFMDSLASHDSILVKSIRKINGKASLETHSLPFEQSFIDRTKYSPDSLKMMKGIQSVVIALAHNDITFSTLDSLLNRQLEAKGISASYYFDYLENGHSLETTKSDSDDFPVLETYSKSTYLRPTQELKLYHSDPTIDALKKSFTGILLSLILSLTVIGSLFYLLKIINKQKELAEIKNDLISNITHEFKTPIATVSTAIEAIENFNVLDDKEKTQKYLSMSSLQLKKLHQMVEKLLETATLDSENLILNKEQIDVIDLVSRIATKHELLTAKKISFSSNVDSKVLNIDLFHFENAVSNLIDNAIKYGGDTVEITINTVLNTTEISVADDGNGIEKSQQEKIFDKFYRVPKGNQHDVKGFGIGLYYAKKIIEKHEGEIQLVSNNSNTVFKISIPNG